MKENNLPFVGIGTWGLKNRECENTIFTAINNGYTFIDTASVYDNEHIIGDTIKKNKFDRNKITIISKINTFKYHVFKSVNKSLKDLKTDYIDIVLIHWPIFKTSLDDYMEQLIKLKKDGKIKTIGVSNFNINLIKYININFPKVLKFNQIEYHPFLDQTILLKEMSKMKINPIAYCPLSRGKINYNKVIKSIALKYNKTCSQVVLKWLAKQKISSVPGSSNKQNIINNIKLDNFDIDNFDMKQISGLRKLNFRNIKNISEYKFD